MSEERLQRLEDKVDRVKEDVSELKADFKVHATEINGQMRIFADHITGDQKIINEIEPLLSQLPKIAEIVENHQFEKELRKRKMDKVKYWTARLGLVSIVVGIFVGLSKL